MFQHVDEDGIETYISPILEKWNDMRPIVLKELNKDCRSAMDVRMFEERCKINFIGHCEKAQKRWHE